MENTLWGNTLWEIHFEDKLRQLRKNGDKDGSLLKFVLKVRGEASALCGYPIVKMEIRGSSQISTTAPIFLLSYYFRQKYLKIASCAVSILNNIWVQVEHGLLQQLNLQKVNCSSSSLQAGSE